MASTKTRYYATTFKKYFHRKPALIIKCIGTIKIMLFPSKTKRKV